VTDRLIRFTTALAVVASVARSSRISTPTSRQNQCVPRLALWSLDAGIVATVGANLAHGLGHGAIGALVSARPALALVGALNC
jgi:hypothetical protein